MNNNNVMLNLRTGRPPLQPMTDDEAIRLLDELRLLYIHKREGTALGKAIESIKKAKLYKNEVLHDF